MSKVAKGVYWDRNQKQRGNFPSLENQSKSQAMIKSSVGDTYTRAPPPGLFGIFRRKKVLKPKVKV
jgi:hypothetical protein